MTKFICVAFWIAIFMFDCVVGVRGLKCMNGNQTEDCPAIDSNSLKLPERDMKMGCYIKNTPNEMKGCEAVRPDPDGTNAATAVCAPSAEGGKQDCVCFADNCNGNNIPPEPSKPSQGECAKPPKESGGGGVNGGTILEAVSVKSLMMLVGMVATIYFQD